MLVCLQFFSLGFNSNAQGFKELRKTLERFLSIQVDDARISWLTFAMSDPIPVITHLFYFVA
ncbi:hypothetical protein FRUB_03198 [Fimbriiglobus ruber]|uniref:Uncharacterized protein n=1 Tax=Fimbriiglobus ruber TaxID=1908690 RepID=A0A225E287_9BACT|nr:hypothetical protein FRUB_03198 [Fimbriiglobus ruber]